MQRELTLSSLSQELQEAEADLSRFAKIKELYNLDFGFEIARIERRIAALHEARRLASAAGLAG